MILKQIHIWVLTVFIFYFLILIGLNIVGPDYFSYAAASELSITQNFFKLRELFSWLVIDFFAQIDTNFELEFLGLRIFSSFLFSMLFFISFKLISEDFTGLKFKIRSASNTKLIIMFLTFFVSISPYVSLLALSALRQGIAILFLSISILSISRQEVFKSYLYFILALLSHNSVMIFLPLFVFIFFKSSKLRFFLIFFASFIYLILSSMITSQVSVDADNRLIYGLFSVLSLAIFFINRKKFSNLDLLLVSSIVVTLPFFNLESYYDRLGLYSAFFASIIISKKIITTGPLSVSVLLAFSALIFSFLFSALLTYPPLMS